MDTRREFIKKVMLFSGAAGFSGPLQETIARAAAIDPAAGSTYLDAEHVVILMQENRSFDHALGALQGVRGFNDPRALRLANGNLVWLQSNAAGETYAPFRLDIKDTRTTWMGSLPHSRHTQVDAWNDGQHDRWLEAKKPTRKTYAALPLTMGHYTRDDLPFYYALADAFTVCDQHYCGVMTSTTPNRSLFWSGNIRENATSKAHLRNEDYSRRDVPWRTFPEELQRLGVSWKFYQNEITANGLLSRRETGWLGNFGCNALEYFARYQVKLSPGYLAGLQRKIAAEEKVIRDLEAKITPQPVDDDPALPAPTLAEARKSLRALQADLAALKGKTLADLSPEERQLFERAFVINSGDPDFRSVEKIAFEEEGKRQEMYVPKGDILHQFRHDVQTGRLPTVSWLASPGKFSDHPSSPWFGAWYVSEVMSILTRNPEVWKKTIFILTYDENDGYFDHAPSFVAPDPKRPETGATSPGCAATGEYVYREEEIQQGVAEGSARTAPVGLGFRVPLFVASPWSRGGWVNSQLFDHTSATQFLEDFLSKKLGRAVRNENISPWRRAISGDLTSCFREFQGEKLAALPFLERDPFVISIALARSKKIPTGFKKLEPGEIEAVNRDPRNSPLVSHQENGIRPSCALPYQLYAEGSLNAARNGFRLSFHASDRIFGARAKGSPFNVYARGLGAADAMQCATYSVAAGERLEKEWLLQDFAGQAYQFSIHGPNGFFREYLGNAGDPDLAVSCEYQTLPGKPGQLSGHVELILAGRGVVEITDHAYRTAPIRREVRPEEGSVRLALDLAKSFGWYDFTVRVAGADRFARRYAGRVETGRSSFSDPLMGGMVS